TMNALVTSTPIIHLLRVSLPGSHTINYRLNLTMKIMKRRYINIQADVSGNVLIPLDSGVLKERNWLSGTIKG
ncbi:13215_t:CDS:1, partial [Acaulospora morrowiae]